jgi:hypothetical protein
MDPNSEATNSAYSAPSNYQSAATQPQSNNLNSTSASSNPPQSQQ